MLVVGVEKISQLDTITATTYFSFGSDFVFEGACGASFPGLYGAIARSHMSKYGTTEEQASQRCGKKPRERAVKPECAPPQEDHSRRCDEIPRRREPPEAI